MLVVPHHEAGLCFPPLPHSQRKKKPVSGGQYVLLLCTHCYQKLL